ncbi:hypothetical protein Tco_0408212 [Tanacetum coccineum]
MLSGSYSFLTKRIGKELLLVQNIRYSIFAASTPELCDLIRLKIIDQKFQDVVIVKISFFLRIHDFTKSYAHLHNLQSNILLKSLKKNGFESCDPGILYSHGGQLFQVQYDGVKAHTFLQSIPKFSLIVPEIYMQEFWASAYIHNRSVRFKMNNKKHILNLDQFGDILQICPKVGNKKFEEPPLEKEIPQAFLASLGHSGMKKERSRVNVKSCINP